MKPLMTGLKCVYAALIEEITLMELENFDENGAGHRQDWGRLKYPKVFSPFALAVSTRLYRTVLDFAPLEDSIKTKIFLPRVNGRIACSA